MTTQSKQSQFIRQGSWIAAIMLLLFNGAGAIYGGVGLIRHPDGSSIGLDLKLLKDTPFSNYYVPGLILLVVNGLIDLAILILTLSRFRYYYLFITGQGAVLIGWLSIQLILIHALDKMHLIMGATGILLIVSGIVLRSRMTKNIVNADHDQ